MPHVYKGAHEILCTSQFWVHRTLVKRYGTTLIFLKDLLTNIKAKTIPSQCYNDNLIGRCKDSEQVGSKAFSNGHPILMRKCQLHLSWEGKT
jgi:hypothetical protein